MIQQETSEGGIVLQTTKVGLRNHTTKQGRVPAKTVSINFGAGVHVCSVCDQPAGNLDLVKVNAHVQQGCACQRRAMQSQRMVCVASELGWINLFVRKRASKQTRIALEMRLQKINATAMQSHHWRIRKGDAALGNEFQAAMLPFRAAAIGLQKQSDWCKSIAMFIGEFGAKFEQERETLGVQRISRTHDAPRRRMRTHSPQ